MSTHLDAQNPNLPSGAQPLFITLAAAAFLAMASAVFAYGLAGERLTQGLDAACAEASFQAGQHAEAEGNFEPALLRYREAMAGRFENEQRRFECGRAIGDLLLRQKRYAEAVAAYEALPKEAFSTAGHYTGYATALAREMKFEQAEQIALEWLRLAEAEGNSEQVLWASSILVEANSAQGEQQAVLAYADKAISVNPGAGAAIVAARVLHEQGQAQAAQAKLETFLQHVKDSKLEAEARKLLDSWRL